jgi:hypothetical protein
MLSGPRLYAALGTGLLIAALVVALVVTRARLASVRTAHAAELSAIRERIAEAKAADLAHARAVEAAQSETNRKVSDAYQADLATLRARLERLRTSTAQGGGGTASVPSLPVAPCRSDAAPSGYTVSPELMFEAEANTLQLTALQAWVKAQEDIAR